MRIELYPARELPAELIARWDQIVPHYPELASPYFRPEFTQAVAAVREHVEVGVLFEGEQAVGFFSFERMSSSAARPVGGRLSDYQGVIAAPDTPWLATELMQACRLRAWEFDHQLAWQSQLQPQFAAVAKSWRVDLSAGYDAYLAGRKAAGAGALAEMLRKSRKLRREHAIRCEWHTGEAAVLAQLLAWKSAQYLRSGQPDLFAHAWITSLIKAIWQTQTPQFAGVLSVLYADERIAAVHFGMQSGSLLHSWFPAYDLGLRKYSPGSALLLHLFEQAAEHGVTCVELGKGDSEYKLTLANDSRDLATGVVETRAATAAFRSGWEQARDWVRNSPLREPAEVPIRWLRRMRDWWALR